MNNFPILVTSVFTLTLLSSCKVEEKIKNSFVDYASPLEEITANPDTPARSLPTNPAECPDWKKNETIQITESMTLPAGCKYDRVNLLITGQSNLTLDCNGAELNGIDREYRQAINNTYSIKDSPLLFGIKIQSSESFQSENITVKNCVLKNYVRGIRVNFGLSSQSLSDLKNNINITTLEEHLRSISPRNIIIENCTINYSHKDGVFIGRFVTGFILDKSEINYTGAVGLYLDSGSQGNLIKNSKFTNNGHSDYDIARRTRVKKLANDTREAIAIDSSAKNIIQNNQFVDNAGGAVFIYKNCNEHYKNPNQIPRYQSADNNLITENIFTNENVGVWIASRQSKNLNPLECGSPVMAAGTVNFGPKKEDATYYEDFAKHNQVTKNTFTDVKRGIIIEDDHSSVIENTFNGSADEYIQVGTKYRGGEFAHPVTSTLIEGNTFNGNPSELIQLIHSPIETVIKNNKPISINNQ